MATSACILGCSGPRLTADERAFFAAARPWGFILFRRNVEHPAQVKALVAELREAVGRPDAPVLVDQEGGRVQRLGPPHWPKYPPARAWAEAAADADEAAQLAWLGGRLIAHDLQQVGVTVDCAPVLDVPTPGAHDIIGDRALAGKPAEVARLGRAVAEGLMAGGVLPVIKHMPGHGRAGADSHHDLPVVDAPREALQAWDFQPFAALRDLPMAMTAHVVYPALDRSAPATTSPAVVRLMRERIGFSGLIMTDDLSMKALSGPMEARAAGALAAGCDIALHCNGRIDEMKAVVAGAGPLAGDARGRAEAALDRLQPPKPFDVEAGRARFFAALKGRLEAAAGPEVGE